MSNTVEQVILNPYWQIYGELFLDDFRKKSKCIEVENTTQLHNLKEGQFRCSSNSKVVVTISAIYMLIANVLLLNLLIALFASTYEKINQISDAVWKFQRAELIMEYRDKPPFPFPFIIISHINFFYRLVKNWVLKVGDYGGTAIHRCVIKVKYVKFKSFFCELRTSGIFHFSRKHV